MPDASSEQRLAWRSRPPWHPARLRPALWVWSAGSAFSPLGAPPPCVASARGQGRPLRAGGVNELVCSLSCPAGWCLARGPGDGCRSVLGGPGRALNSLQPSPGRGGWPGSAQGPSALRPMGPEWSPGAWPVDKGGPGMGPPGLPVDPADVGRLGVQPSGRPLGAGRGPGWPGCGWPQPMVSRLENRAALCLVQPGCTRQRRMSSAAEPGSPARPGSQGSPSWTVVSSGSGGCPGSLPARSVVGEGGRGSAASREAPRSAPARKPHSVGPGGEPPGWASGPVCPPLGAAPHFKDRVTGSLETVVSEP